MDILPRIPAIRWLSIGQQDGMTDSVMKVGFLKNRLKMSFQTPLFTFSTAPIGLISCLNF